MKSLNHQNKKKKFKVRIKAVILKISNEKPTKLQFFEERLKWSWPTNSFFNK